jgi:nucleotide-binding universal stress UspA family protein
VLVDPFEDGADAGYTDVLVPTDGSEGAEAAAPHGAAVAARYEATLHALCVVDVQAAGGPFDAGGLDAAFVERLEGEAREAVDRVLERVAAAEPDVATASAVERSDPFVGAAPGIEEYVTENGVDLVVMGSHGRSGLGRRLLGSVTSTLLRTANVPVIVVRRD